MLSVLLFAAGLVGSFAFGAPIAVRLAQPDAWRAWLRTAAKEVASQRATPQLQGFAPLDLGPDPVHWPSERPWPKSRIAEPEWPSKGWNDEHFGTHWRKGPTHHAFKSGNVPSSGQTAEAAADAHEAAEAWFDGESAGPPTAKARPSQKAPAPKSPAPVQKVAAQRAAAQKVAVQKAAAQQAAVQKAAQKPAAQKPAVQKPAVQKAPAGARPAPTPAEVVTAVQSTGGLAPQGTPPSREELQHLSDTVGLAGTVKVIMERTGWDFRTAAQYLAQNR